MPVPSTWNERELPLLEAVYLGEEAGEEMLTTEDAAGAAGIDPDVAVQRDARALRVGLCHRPRGRPQYTRRLLHGPPVDSSAVAERSTNGHPDLRRRSSRRSTGRSLRRRIRMHGRRLSSSGIQWCHSFAMSEPKPLAQSWATQPAASCSGCMTSRHSPGSGHTPGVAAPCTLAAARSSSTSSRARARFWHGDRDPTERHTGTRSVADRARSSLNPAVGFADPSTSR